MAVSWIPIGGEVIARRADVWTQIARVLYDRYEMINRHKVGVGNLDTLSYLGRNPQNTLGLCPSGAPGALVTQANYTMITEIAAQLEALITRNISSPSGVRITTTPGFINSDGSAYTGPGSPADGGVINADRAPGYRAHWKWFIERFRDILDGLEHCGWEYFGVPPAAAPPDDVLTHVMASHTQTHDSAAPATWAEPAYGTSGYLPSITNFSAEAGIVARGSGSGPYSFGSQRAVLVTRIPRNWGAQALWASPLTVSESTAIRGLVDTPQRYSGSTTMVLRAGFISLSQFEDVRDAEYDWSDPLLGSPEVDISRTHSHANGSNLSVSTPHTLAWPGGGETSSTPLYLGWEAEIDPDSAAVISAATPLGFDERIASISGPAQWGADLKWSRETAEHTTDLP